jgi:hypothetical protein
VDFLSSISVHDQKQVSTIGIPRTSIESPPRRAFQLYSSAVLHNDNSIVENDSKTSDYDVDQQMVDDTAILLAQSGAQSKYIVIAKIVIFMRC